MFVVAIEYVMYMENDLLRPQKILVENLFWTTCVQCACLGAPLTVYCQPNPYISLLAEAKCVAKTDTYI